MEAYDRGKEGETRMHQVEGSGHDLVGSCTERENKKRKRQNQNLEKGGEKVARKILASGLCINYFLSISELEVEPVYCGITNERILSIIHSCRSPGN